MGWFNELNINEGSNPGNFLDYVYPVGSIYISVNSTNPGELFGGTWQEFAPGRMLMGVGNVLDADGYTQVYSDVKTTGGYLRIRNVSHTHLMNHGHEDTFSTNSAGSHTHTINHGHSDNFSTASGGSHTHTMNHGHSDNFSTASSGSHTHATFLRNANASDYPSYRYMVDSYGTGGSAAGWAPSMTATSSRKKMTTDSQGSHTHTVNGSVTNFSGDTGSSGSHTHTINGAVTNYSGDSGSSGSHSHTVKGAVTDYKGYTSSQGVEVSGRSEISVSDYNVPPYITVYIWERIL